MAKEKSRKFSKTNDISEKSCGGSKEKLKAASCSIWVNVFLILLKLVTAVFTGSLGILAEFIHSFFDLLASFFAYMGIKHASKPADRDHHYGHDRMENISSLIQSFLITLTSAFILFEAYKKITRGEFGVKESLIGIIVMVLAIGIDIVISIYLHKKSESTGSPALEADAYHFTTDIMSTVAVIVGLIATMLGFPIADIIAAVIVAIIMLVLSFQLGLKAIKVMLDQAPDEMCVEEIAGIIGSYPGLKGFHSLRVREAGSRLFVDVCIHLDRNLTLKKAHAISEKLELKVLGICLHVKEVIIHVEPDEEHNM